MAQRLAVFALLVSAAVLAPGAVGAQQASDDATLVVTDTDATEFPTVRLSVAASGDAAAALDGGDVTVAEDGTEVAAEADAVPTTFDVALAIDVSGSMEGEPLEQAKLAALRFVDELPDRAGVAVVGFGNDAALVSPLGTDREATGAAIQGLSAGGETALYDAVALSADEMVEESTGRTAVVVLTDGADNGSNTALDDAAEAVAESGAEFFAVSLRSENSNDAALAELSGAVEGRIIGADQPDELTAAYQGLADQLRNRYEIVYESQATSTASAVELTAGGVRTSVDVDLPARAAAAVTPTVAEDPGFTASSAALWVGVGLVAVALAAAVGVAVSGERRTLPRRNIRTDDTSAVQTVSPLKRVAQSVQSTATKLSDQAVARSERQGTIDAALDRAGINMRAGEFVAAAAGAALVAAIVFGLLMGPFGIVIGIVAVVFLSPVVLDQLASRRTKKFDEQLGDALMIIAGSMRAGIGVAQAIDNIAEEMDDPIAEEFGRAVLETRLGRTIEDGLAGVAERMHSEDLEWVVEAVRINREVGGDLSQILDRVATTIRTRFQTRRKIDALTAEGRISALVLGLMPLGMAGIMYTTNPEYMSPLWTTGTGRIMLGVGIALLAAGGASLKKLISMEV